MRVGELFAGYSGLGMGLKLVYPDAEVAWVSEIDPGACKVLAHRYPGAPNLGDITAIDWSQVEPVDVATAGFPCTDVSTAGKQAGLIHGTRSGLWHEVVRYAREHRPPLLILENVRGLLSARGDESEELDAAEDKVRRIDDTAARLTQMRDRAQKRGDREQVTSIDRRAVRLLVIRDRAVVARKRAERRVVRAIGTVVGTLADIGYDAVWCGLRAADVGACHGRFRVFGVAYPQGNPWRLIDGDLRTAGHSESVGRIGREAQQGWALDEPAGNGPRETDADPTDLGHQWGGRAWEWRAGPANGDLLPTPTTRDHKGHNQRRGDTCLTGALLPTPRATDGTHGGPNQRGSSGDLMLPSAVARLLPTPTTEPQTGDGHARNLGAEARRWGDYAEAIARWESLTRPAPPPTEINPKNGRHRLSPRFEEWMMGLPDGWVTDVPGVTWAEAVRMCGNGVVPQQAAAGIAWCLSQIDALGGAA